MSTSTVARLLGLGLTPGKLYGLQQISNPDGTLTMLAIDQNNSIVRMARKYLAAQGEDRDPTYEEVVEYKLELTREIAPAASAVLLDAVYGAWNAVASFALPRTTGLLVRVEESGAARNPHGGYVGRVEPGWGVEKIKQMGAHAVKLLVQYEPSEPDSAEHQFALARDIYDACQWHDILFLLETTSFQFPGEDKTAKSYLDRKAQTVIESARHLSGLCDIYKAEFPGTLGHESDAQLRDNLKELNAACKRPWVLLSAGVDFDAYRKQVEMAVEAGASGVLGGRAFWKEYFEQPSPEAMTEFCRGEARSRVSAIDSLVRVRATPWFVRYGLKASDLTEFRAAEGWYHRYAGPGVMDELAGGAGGDY
jgi:tagatose 1,6-diphosphate aldolase